MLAFSHEIHKYQANPNVCGPYVECHCEFLLCLPVQLVDIYITVLAATLGASGAKYVGEYKDDKRNGQGTKSGMNTQRMHLCSAVKPVLKNRTIQFVLLLKGRKKKYQFERYYAIIDQIFFYAKRKGCKMKKMSIGFGVIAVSMLLSTAAHAACYCACINK